jgi:hypothetical protein
MVLRFLTNGFSSLLNIGKFIKWPQKLGVVAGEFYFLKIFLQNILLTSTTLFDFILLREI